MKKILFVSFFALVLSPIVSADFSDTHGTSSREAVEYLLNNGIVEGFSDGTFRPDKDITRAEFLKIALKTSEDYGDDSCIWEGKTFSDVHPDDWFYNVVCDASNNGIIMGYADGTFRPHEQINVRDAAKIVSEVQGLSIPASKQGEWFEGYIGALQRERVMPGSITDTADLLTRGEMSEMVWGIVTGNEVENTSLGDLPTLNSCDELEAQLQKAEKRLNTGALQTRNAMVDSEMEFADFAVTDGDSAGVSAMVEEKTMAPAADDFSETNIQEEGVDEADIIKNDGSHIFLLKGKTVRIISAIPTDTMKEVARISLDEEKILPREMFLDGDRLTLIGEKNGMTVSPYEDVIRTTIMPDMPYYSGATEVVTLVYDVSDRENPKKLRTVAVEGEYVSSRRIDEMVYVVVNKGWNAFRGGPEPIPLDDLLPAFSDSTHPDEVTVAGCDEVRYIPNFQYQNYLIVASVNTRDASEKAKREVVLGGGNQVYASQKNLYVTNSSWDEIFWERGNDSGWENTEGTDIYKFSLSNGDIAFDGKGRVRGRLLNQFSMSEYNDYFRVATQVGQAWGSHLSESMVTILDSNLKQTGVIDGIAPGENLKSARFMGKRAFLITFKTVDPLFVIDLTPTAPKILGKLKIPGWSDYLQPFGEKYLIGFGKEVDESIDADKVHSDSAVYYTAVLGMKLSLFDVSDLANPREIQKEVIGSRGTTSEVLTNHKALLFDEKKGILGFPVTITENKNNKTGDEADIETVFSGARVYDVSVKDGFTLRGEVSHYDADDDSFLKSGEYFYGDADKNIQRIIYIGKNFFSISPNIISALSWDDLSLKNRITLDEKTCSEIRTENECISRSECKAVYFNESQCERNFGGEIVCSDNPQFSHCEKGKE